MWCSKGGNITYSWYAMLTQFSTYKLMWGCRNAAPSPKSAQKQDCCSIRALRAYYQPELSELATLWQGLMTVALHAFPQQQRLDSNRGAIILLEFHVYQPMHT